MFSSVVVIKKGESPETQKKKRGCVCCHKKKPHSTFHNSLVIKQAPVLCAEEFLLQALFQRCCLVVDDKDRDLAVREGRAAARRVVDVVHVVARAAGDEHVVATAVHVRDETVAAVDRRAHSRVGGVLHAVEVGEAERIRLGPVDEAAARVAAVVAQPRVEDAGVAAVAAVRHEHGDRGDRAAALADGVRARAETVVAPRRAALPPRGRVDANDSVVVAGSSDGSNARDSDESQETHLVSKKNTHGLLC